MQNLTNRTVLFDLDGTLFNTAPDLHLAINLLLEEEQQPLLSYENLCKEISHGSTKIIETAFNLSLTEQELQVLRFKLIERYKATAFKNTDFFPGIKQLLDNLDANDITWGIVTNRIEELAKPLVKLFNLDDRAACLVGGDTTPFAKPHPAPLLHACDYLQVQPQNCIYIGDAEKDMIAGKSAGMLTIAALFGYIAAHEDPNNWPADHYAHSAYDLWPQLQQTFKLCS